MTWTLQRPVGKPVGAGTHLLHFHIDTGIQPAKEPCAQQALGLPGHVPRRRAQARCSGGLGGCIREVLRHGEVVELNAGRGHAHVETRPRPGHVEAAGSMEPALSDAHEELLQFVAARRHQDRTAKRPWPPGGEFNPREAVQRVEPLAAHLERELPRAAERQCHVALEREARARRVRSEGEWQTRRIAREVRERAARDLDGDRSLVERAVEPNPDGPARQAHR